MDPFLDEGSNGIEIFPDSPEDIKIGDIISYRFNQYDDIIIHRVIEIGEDENGIYYIAKGDNNKYLYSEKIRFDQIRGVLIGIIY